MNECSIGVNRGQVGNSNTNTFPSSATINPLDLSNSAKMNEENSVIDSSPTLSNFSNNWNSNVLISTTTTEKNKSPENLILCSVVLCIVAGLWLSAGHLIQFLTPVYNSPSMLTYFSVISLQFYFFLIPKRRADRSLSMSESDLGFDTYTNREAFKFAGYLFILFTFAVGLIIKGLSMFPHPSYCGSFGLMGLLALIFLTMGMKTESITRYKLLSIGFLTVSAVLTMLEPVIWDNLEVSSFLNYGSALSVVGVMLLALFFVLLTHQLEHTHIHKPMLFAFMGLFCMLISWIFFIPLHLFKLEILMFPPPKEEIYWSILGVIVLGTMIPFYLIQWVLTRTSVLFVCVLLGSIIPIYGIAESVYFLEFNWLNLAASLLSAAAIITIQYRYK